MKIAVIIVRVLFGLMFVFAGVVGLFKLMPMPELSGSAKAFMDGMVATVYFLPLLAGTQLACGIAFVVGRFVALATVVIFPIMLNILLYHIYVDPKTLPVAIVLMAMNLFLAFAYRQNYKTLLAPK